MDRPLSIAIVTPAVSRRGGTEKCLQWLVEDLSRYCDVTVFAGELADTDVSRTRVHLLPMIRHPRVLKYLTFLLSNTVALVARRVARKASFDLVFATAGDCVFADVIYAHFCCAAYAAMLREGQVSLPATSLRQSLRNLHYHVFISIAGLIERAIYQRPSTQAIIAVSAGTRRELVRYYQVDPARVAVVQNAVDDRVRVAAAESWSYRGEVRTEYGIESDALVLLFVAAADWKRKGLLLVIESLAMVRDSRVHLLVVGREDVAFYQATAERLGVAGAVHFCGFAPEVERYYAAADVFVFPSAYEAFSLVTLEAAGAGLPLIVTRINGTEDLVEDGENGFFVEAAPADIAARVRLLLDDRERRKRMSAAAVAVSQGYSREAMTSGVLQACALASTRTSGVTSVAEPPAGQGRS